MQMEIKTLQYRGREHETHKQSNAGQHRMQQSARRAMALIAVLTAAAAGLASVYITIPTRTAAVTEATIAAGTVTETGPVTETSLSTGEGPVTEASLAAEATTSSFALTLRLDTLQADITERMERLQAAERNTQRSMAANAVEADNDLEEDMILMLLSSCDSEDIEAAVEANAHAERIAAAAASVPESLTFRYNPDMCLTLSTEELEILERIVEAEATGEDVYGRILVANVVINRVHSKYFADSVEDVVFETIGGDAQFSPVKDGRFYTVTVTDLTREAVARALDGEDYSQGALYFFQRSRTTSSRASWFDRHTKYLFKYGCHEFFTEY